MKSLKLMGAGAVVPERVVRSTEIDDYLGLPLGTIESETGVEYRFYAQVESATDLAVSAISQALDRAQLSLDDIDCIIGASGTLEQAIPYNAARVHSAMGFHFRVPAFDVNMTCLSSLMALEVASNLLYSKRFKNILIFSSDIASVGLDWSNRHIGGLFGDGAAAFIVSEGSASTEGVLASHFQTMSEGVNYCEIRGGGSLNHPSNTQGDYSQFGLFEMRGKEVYRLTAAHIQRFIEELFEPLAFNLSDIDWVVPHQASKSAITHMQKKLRIPSKKIINIIGNRGNQIAASIPSALCDLLYSRPVKAGDTVLLIGTSAGLSIGGVVLSI